MRRAALIIPALATLLGISACGDTTTSSSSSSSSSAPTASSTPVATCATGSLSADGSSAIKALVQKAATEYQAKCPGSTITVAATNSSTGVTKASSGAVDVGDSDVPASLVQGVDASTVIDHQVAIVNFSVVVNSGSGVTNLSLQQIRDIFSGKTTNWKDVGGKDLPIAVLERKPGSGTRFSFDLDVMQGANETSSPAQVVDTTQTVIQSMSTTPGGISYVATASLKGTSLVGLTIDGHASTASEISAGNYPFYSHEHCFTGKSPSLLALSFIQYIQSETFQSGTLTSSGYLPLSTTTKQAAVDQG